MNETLFGVVLGYALSLAISKVWRYVGPASKPKRLDEYAIGATEEPIRRLEVTLKTEDGATCTYLLEAPFAHQLSDELLRAAVHVAPKTRGEVRTLEIEDLDAVFPKGA